MPAPTGRRRYAQPSPAPLHSSSIKTEEKQQRFSGEKERLKSRHAVILEQGDPYYNPNLTHDREDYSIR